MTDDLEADISLLQAPTFTTLTRGPPEPMLHLNWNLPVNLIGEKVLNPMIHCCDKCLKPILIYGRLVSIYITFFSLKFQSSHFLFLKTKNRFLANMFFVWDAGKKKISSALGAKTKLCE